MMNYNMIIKSFSIKKNGRPFIAGGLHILSRLSKLTGGMMLGVIVVKLVFHQRRLAGCIQGIAPE